jgi:hypothetical protein
MKMTDVVALIDAANPVPAFGGLTKRRDGTNRSRSLHDRASSGELI